MKTTIQKNNAVTDESLERFGNMYFETNANGINIKLQIRGYTPTNEDDWHSEWCECDYSFSSGNWLNYHKEGDEAFLSIEVEGLARAFSDLLDNKITEVTEMTCAEPDFIFKLFPQADLRNDPKYTYIRPGCEIRDIYLEWKIYFWDDGLTDNHLSVKLDRADIVRLRDYFESVING